MSLKVFDGFSQDMVVDLTGLSASQLRTFREADMISPTYTRVGYKYSFADILTLRLVNDLINRFNVKTKNIKKAHKYLSHIDPSKSLRDLKLYVKTGTGVILCLGPKVDEAQTLIDMTKFGQMCLAGLIIVLPVGEHLEKTRQQVVKLDTRLDQSRNTRNFVSLETFKKKLGYA